MAKDVLGLKLEDLRREQILAAAIQVFSQKGFRVARMQEVADAAGVSNGTVYNYFRSKDELLLALLEQLSERERHQEQMEQVRGGDPQSLVQRLQRRFRALQEHQELWRVILPELITNARLRQQGYERIFGPIFELGEATLAELLPSGKSPDLEAPHLIRVLTGSVLGVFVLALLDDKTEQEAGEILATLAKTFVAAFPGGDGRGG